VAHRGQTPNRDRDRVPDARAYLVDETSYQEQSYGVGGLKRDHNLAVLNLIPSDDSLKIRSKYAQHLPVDIVNRGCEEQQGANAPSIAAHSGRDGLA
jgi:hypothetical protein